MHYHDRHRSSNDLPTPITANEATITYNLNRKHSHSSSIHRTQYMDSIPAPLVR
jgi:hypothetical protein